MTRRDASAVSPRPVESMGIDGCRAGWVVAFRTEGSLALRVVNRLADLSSYLAPTTTVMIDMPIGLMRSAGSRQCDVLARTHLRPHRSSSVFSVPARAVTRCEDYVTANRLSKSLSSKGISKQAFYLFPKIRELDDWLVAADRAGDWHECHPEVAFAQLNAGLALSVTKKAPEGRAQRLDLLAPLGNVTPVIEQALAAYPRKDVLPDDLIDALVCLLTAECSPNDRVMLPEEPIFDQRGLRMAIVAPR